MPKEDKKETTESAVVKPQSPDSAKPQLLRVSTIVRNNKIDSVTAKAVMTANKLKPVSRIEPGKFLKMVETFRSRKIKTTGRR